MLPDYDLIPSLNCDVGMYHLSRWTGNVMRQIEFLKEVQDKFGADAAVQFVGSCDGYPGYIQVVFKGE